jgi:threonine dehydrogenase-like Zn-dependent dehydrogenase
VPEKQSVLVLGLGPIGEMCTRVAQHLGAETVIGIDLVPDRLAMAQRHGVTTIDAGAEDDVPKAVRDLTDGRGADSVIDAVGMEAHGSTVASAAHRAVAAMPDSLGRRLMEKAGLDKLSVLHAAIATVRRGGTISLSGVYGGMADPMPMMELFDKQVQLRMGQANVRRWVDDLLPLVEGDEDPLGVEDLATHRLPLTDAPKAYADFQQKRNGTIKVLLQP